MRVPLQWLKQYVDVQASAEEVATRLTMGGLEVEGIEQPEDVLERLTREGAPEARARAAAAMGPILDVYITPNRGDCLSMVGVAREVAALYGLELRAPAPPTAEVASEDPGQTEGLLPGFFVTDLQASAQNGRSIAPTRVRVEEPQLCPRYAARLVLDVAIAPSPDWMQARLEAAGQRPINNVVDVTNYVMLELGQPLHAFDLTRLNGQQIVVRRARSEEPLRTLDGVDRTLSTEMLVIADADRAVAVAGLMGGETSEVTETTTDLLLESAHFDPLTVRRTARALGLRTEASYRFERVVDPNGVLTAVNRACELLREIARVHLVPGAIDVYPAPILPTPVTLRTSRATELLGTGISPEIATDCLTRLGFEVAGSGARLEVQVPTFRADIRLEEDLVEEVGRIYGYENIPETLPIGATTRGGDSEEGRLLTRIRQALAGSGLQEVITHSLTAPSFFDPPEDAAAQSALARVPVRNALSSEVSGLRRSLLPNLLDVARNNVARGANAMSLFEIGRVWRHVDGVAVETLSVAALLMGPLTPPSWQSGGRAESADFATARGVVERLLNSLHIPDAAFERVEPGTHPDLQPLLRSFHPGRTASVELNNAAERGILGELHPQVQADLSLRERVLLFEISLDALRAAMPASGPRFRSLSPFQAVSRDLAPRVLLSVRYEEIAAAVRAAEIPLLEEFRLRDVYTGSPLPEGTKSLTLTFTFRSADQTLKEAEINAAMDRIRESLVQRCGAEFAS